MAHKRISQILCLTLCLTLARTFAVPSMAAQTRHSGTAEAWGVNQQLLHVEQQWITAENKHDAKTLRGILDDKFISCFEMRKPIDKETFIRGIVRGKVDPSAAQSLTDRTVVVDNDTAVVIGTDTMTGTRNGAPFKLALRYSVTYIRRNGQWKALAEYLMRVPPEKND